MKIGRWSTTAANNNSTPPDGWPEGQAPSTVNDCAREMMASIRTMLNDMSFIDLDHSPTQTSSTTFTIPGNVTTFYDYGRRVKCFVGASTLYGTVISSSFTTNTGITLRLDSGLLTTSLSSVAVSVLGNANYAIPDPALVNTCSINTNGQLEIWQNTVPVGISGSAAGSYITDMWAYAQNGASVVNGNRLERSASASNVPTVAQCGQLLNSSLVLSVSAADAALAASDFARLSTVIEGYDFRPVAGKPISVSFWVHTNRTGTYCLAVGNAVDRTYVTEYTISATNTWEKKTIAIPEIPTAGTWDYSTGIGLFVTWTLAAGTSFQSTANQWTTMAALATSNQTNWLASAGHAFRIAGVKVNEGTQAFPLEYRPYDKELAKCQRYYQKFDQNRVIFGYCVSTTNAIFTLPLDPEMRTAPTVAFPAVNTMQLSNSGGGAVSVSAVATINTPTFRHVQINVAGVGAPFVAGNGSAFTMSGTDGATVIFNARL